jgi:hypothetical protein
MPGLLDFAQDPRMALAAGLLSPTRNSRTGPALLQGIQAANRQGLVNNRTMAGKQAIAQAEQAAQNRKAFAQTLGQIPTNATGADVRALFPQAQSANQLNSLVNASEAVSPSQSSDPNIVKIAKSIGLQPGTEEFNNFVRENTGRAQTVVNVGGQGPLSTFDVPQPDGSLKTETFRRDSPEAQAALNKGATATGATTLSSNESGGLGEIGAKYETLSRLENSFEDDFASFTKVGGQLQNLIGSKTDIGDFDEQSAWWRDYQSFKNVVRNALFGGALTPGEATEFEKSDVVQGMNAKQIRENLKKQNGIVANAVSRMATPLAQAGKNRAQIDSAIGGKFYTVGEIIVAPNGKKAKVTKGGMNPTIVEIK